MKNNLVLKSFMNASGSPVNENSEIVFSVPSSCNFSHFGETLYGQIILMILFF